MDEAATAVADLTLAMAGAAPSRPQRGDQRVGFTAELIRTSAGVTTLSPLPDHLLVIHVGAPMRVTCRYSGRVPRRLSTHGDIEIVPAGLPGSWEDDAAGAVLALRLSPALLRTAAEGLRRDPDRIEIAPQFQLRDAQIEHIGWALKAEHEAGHPGGRLYAESLGLALATRLLYLNTTPVAQPPARQHGLPERRLQQIVDYVEAHLDRDLSLGQLAALAGMSASHFKVLFKQSTGLPVHQFVIRRRVERAKALLFEGRLTASQVALEAGFAHQSHMARWMRRLLGVTPTDVARSRR